MGALLGLFTGGASLIMPLLLGGGLLVAVAAGYHAIKSQGRSEAASVYLTAELNNREAARKRASARLRISLQRNEDIKLEYNNSVEENQSETDDLKDRLREWQYSKATEMTAPADGTEPEPVQCGPRCLLPDFLQELSQPD